MPWFRPDLAAAAAAQLSYPEHGATRDGGELPAGYRHVLRHQRLGAGRRTFERAVEALFTWRMHRGAGLTALVAPRPAVGEVVIMRLGPRPIGAIAPCRIVYVEDEPRRRGFGYGTLPGHPAAGEESFVVEWGHAAEPRSGEGRAASSAAAQSGHAAEPRSGEGRAASSAAAQLGHAAEPRSGEGRAASSAAAQLGDDDAVFLTIRAFSRFVMPWAMLGPAVRWGQDFVTDRFVTSLRRLSR